MRWPFGPPHLTLKPSKKNTKKNNPPPPEKKTKKKLKKNKEKEKKQKSKNTKIPKNRSSIISENVLFLGGCPKIAVLTTWPRKRAPKKHNKNRGFSKAFLEKQLCVTKRPLLDKKTQIQKIRLSFVFFSFFFSGNNKTH